MGAHKVWWSCLAAVPPSRDAVDWWASPADRTTRYRRLRRLWFDRTSSRCPGDGDERVFSFANPTTGMHVLAQLWENMSLFHPRDIVSRIMSGAGLSGIGAATDCAWSYEPLHKLPDKSAKTGLRDLMPDLILHARDEHNRNLVCIFEAKYDKDPLGPKDRDPDAMLNLIDVRCMAGTRVVIYILPESRRAELEAAVDLGRRDIGMLSWEQMLATQMALACELPAPEVNVVVSSLIRYQGECAGIAVQGDGQSLLSHGVERDHGASFLSECATLHNRDDLPEHVLRFVDGAALFIRCQGGDLPNELPFPYLANEPTFEEIASLPKEERQPAVETVHPLWRLPPPWA